MTVRLGLSVVAVLGATSFCRAGSVRAQDAAPARDASPAAAATARVEMFGGDARHTGRTAARGPREAPAIAWRVRTQHRVFASPAVSAEGWAVFASLDGAVHAVDGDGIVRWSHLGDERVFSSPAVWSDTVVLGHDGDAFVGLDARGAIRWTYRVPEDADSAPVVDATTVYVASRGVAALDPSTGAVRWERPLGGHVFGAPALGPGRRLYVTELLGAVDVLDTASGRVLVHTPMPAPVYGGVLVLDDGAFVVGAGDGVLRSFAADGTARWEYTTRGAAQGQGIRATPALRRDGVVVVGSDDGGVYGVRASDGREVFRATTYGPVRSSARVDADDWSYVGSEDDRVYALRPDGAVGWFVSLGADVDSSPLLLRDGTLVVGCDDGALYALRGSSSP